jgi:hypothetical protein
MVKGIGTRKWKRNGAIRGTHEDACASLYFWAATFPNSDYRMAALLTSGIGGRW